MNSSDEDLGPIHHAYPNPDAEHHEDGSWSLNRPPWLTTCEGVMIHTSTSQNWAKYREEVTCDRCLWRLDHPDVPEPLTADEHKAVTLAGELFVHIVAHVIGDGPSREGDVNELAAAIHKIQHAVMANAAARAYPHMYRVLGGDIAPKFTRRTD